MHEELHELRTSRQTEAAAPGIEASGEASGRDLDGAIRHAESAFDRALEKAAGLPGRIAGPDRETAARLAELDEVSRANRIQERLAAAKVATKPRKKVK